MDDFEEPPVSRVRMLPGTAAAKLGGEAAHITHLRVNVARKIAHLSGEDIVALSGWIGSNGQARLEQFLESVHVFMRGDGPFVNPTQPLGDEIQAIALAFELLIEERGGERLRHSKSG
jgi:hypothetical protein